ncbi:MAG: hypothetical protein H7144_18445 [Burkholderiales bacterium]|nr:hypothetical protein [Phycisphaerae bacterium]
MDKDHSGHKGHKDGMGMKDSMASKNPRENMIVVTGAHGGTATFAYDAGTSKAKMLNSTGDMKECAACMTDVNTYFATGKLDPVCKMCGSKHVVGGGKGAHGGM